LARDVVSTESQLGGELVMGAAQVANVVGVVGAAEGAGGDVVVLEPRSALAANTVRAAPGALHPIAGEHAAPDLVGDVARNTA